MTAVGRRGGPPNVTQGIQTESRTPHVDIAEFTFLKGSRPPRYLNIFGDSYIQTFDLHFLTALGGGGKATDAFHTDAKVRKSWEEFSLIKCGDLGSGYDYTIHGSLDRHNLVDVRQDLCGTGWRRPCQGCTPIP